MFVLQSNTRGLVVLSKLFFRFGKVVNKTKLLSEGFHKYFSRKRPSELDSNIEKSEKALHEKSYELEVVGTLKVMVIITCSPVENCLLAALQLASG